MKKVLQTMWLMGTLFLFCASGAKVDPPVLHEEVKHLLPVDGGIVDIMAIGSSARCDELALKLQQGVRQHPDWWLSYMKSAKLGQPLAYHSNFGMTPKDYEEFLACGKTSMQLVKTGEARIFVKEEGQERYVLDGGKQLPMLSGIVLDLSEQVVETQFGVCRQVSRIEASSAQNVTGPWSGYQWKFEQGVGNLEQMERKAQLKELNVTLVQFSLGRFQEANRGILYYKVQQLQGGLKEGFDLILTFPLG